MATLTADTGLGVFSIEETDGAITALHWRAAKMDEETPLLVEARRQLIAYAQGDLTEFDLPLVPEGGPLRQAVLAEMRAIPFGETKTYGEIAKVVGAPAQAVGQACGANTIPVIIPCHRVTGTGGLGGFSGMGGVETKVELLRHEGAYSLLI
ncbi:MAG: methylated-DNA--[protein]-cysteine S-methyltransferase [Paracoccaceae bacterium]|nr:methylated-DNA--[protein]-cysteine S-methyltransferase [Paracoccaceae bacterium]MDG1370308.1 methylated-DNA--[protein]-cysteine S-methyltransferase [Paracoccaceae bacterium]